MKRLITPCCNKEISADQIFNLITEDEMGITNKNFTCPYCGKPLIAFLDIESIEVEE